MMITIAMILTLQSLSAEDKAKAEDITPKLLVPDINYQPKEGDVVCLYRRAPNGKLLNVVVGASMEGYQLMQEAVIAKDQTGVDKLTESKRAAFLPSGTKVRILGGEGAGDKVLIPGTSRYANAGFSHYRVRFVDGPIADSMGLVAFSEAKRCAVVPAPKAKASAKKAKPRP